VHTAKMLQCLLHFATWPIQHSQIVKFSIAPAQIYNFTLSNHHFHISTFTLQTWQSLHFYGLPKFSRRPLKKSSGCPFFLKVFLAQTLFCWGVFFLGGWGPCISGLPSYLLAYILTYLGYLFTYIPIHLGVGPYPHLPTI
jgi:hypothetical protein